jgi:hypothetical protein
LVVFCVHIVVAKGFNAYISYPWLDIPAHIFGGVAMAYFILVCVAYSQDFLGSIPKAIQLVAAFGLTAVVAIVWEFAEFLSDLAFGTRLNLGVSDTLSDLFFGLLGASVVVLFGSLRSMPIQPVPVKHSDDL